MTLFFKMCPCVSVRSQDVFEGIASLIQCLIQVHFLKKMLVWGISHLEEAETSDMQERRRKY